jgi:hypothetical protein
MLRSICVFIYLNLIVALLGFDKEILSQFTKNHEMAFNLLFLGHKYFLNG